MKKEWLWSVPVIAYAVAWAWIFFASAQAGCSDNTAMAGLRGICLARRIAGLSCFAVYLGTWTLLGAHVAMGKGRSPVIGLILGLTLQFLGCLFMMMWEPRRDNAGRMLHWNEYKHFTPEQREAIRPPKLPDTPEMRRRKRIVVVIAIGAAITMVLAILHNLGKI